jgi:hypothetical protein
MIGWVGSHFLKDRSKTHWFLWTRVKIHFLEMSEVGPLWEEPDLPFSFYRNLDCGKLFGVCMQKFYNDGFISY